MGAVLVAQVRTGRGKGYRNRLAAQGKIPAVVYGKALGSVPVEVSLRDLKKVLGGETIKGKLIDLKIVGDGWERQEKALVKEMQHNPLTGELIHVDFHQVSLTEEVTATVPVELSGEPVGVKKGGVLEHFLREVEISCLPTALPEVIKVDVSSLDVGDTIFVRDLPVPPGVKVLADPGEVVATVVEEEKEEEKPEEAS
ncbi:ribosomal 5S rRNA E-loop binding protein Ctc/L25/TL5 [Ammonifex degensii KC4]|uniref:Large ribosomal subunit protein bL25 n=1 Tax=Ammonifex degensii (strain DSM 10501 / KC4) TaxID=429009 RepID=C9R9C5_AMMDK|nr:50S ribosomal protein L25/general stress protein Ctc [Ammonifex degensii]ACX52904.1 ribosomal 5S rRNA E-loop binding protein Ctc/L25/TL5 [Ammonifex degensii KC4]